MKCVTGRALAQMCHCSERAMLPPAHTRVSICNVRSFRHKTRMPSPNVAGRRRVSRIVPSIEPCRKPHPLWEVCHRWTSLPCSAIDQFVRRRAPPGTWRSRKTSPINSIAAGGRPVAHPGTVIRWYDEISEQTIEITKRKGELQPSWPSRRRHRQYLISTRSMALVQRLVMRHSSFGIDSRPFFSRFAQELVGDN